MTQSSMPGPAFRLKYPMTPDAAWADDQPMTQESELALTSTRVRLADLDAHLHCSVIGTCLTNDELRRVLVRFIDLHEASELELHHEAVRLASKDAQAARALHKALDRRYEPVVKRFAKAKETHEVELLWNEFFRRGDVSAAYWAVLSHRHTSDKLRERVYGEVHMLSHLMGTSTRADLRQRVFLQTENEQLRSQIAKMQDRHQRLVETHDKAEQAHQQTAALLGAARRQLEQAQSAPPAPERLPGVQGSDWVTLQVERREQAEQQARHAMREAQKLRDEADELRARFGLLLQELGAAESQLHRWLADEHDPSDAGHDGLQGARLLYVGGRPSSAQAIREWVERGGGELRRHDGGLEDRKGQLAASIAWADRVLFPVDCIDHDSANSIKRQCTRLGIPFVALRTASLTSFVAALSNAQVPARPHAGSHLCLRHA